MTQKQSPDAEAAAALFPARFKVVETTVPIGAPTNQNPEGGSVSKTGRTELNKAGAVLVKSLVPGHFSDLSKCGILWAPDLKTREIAGRLVSPDVPGVTPIRITKKGKLVVYLGGVFQEHPKLKVTTTSSVSISRQSHPEGDFFVIHLNLALKQTRSGKGKGSDAATAKESPEAKPAVADSQK